MSTQTLKAHPDIRLNIFHQMPEMDRAIGIGKRAGDENISGIVAHGAVYESGFEAGAQGIT
jgi:hypothetical protein